MKMTWSYLSNTFEIKTRKAFIKMLKIAIDHESRLKGSTDALIVAILAFFSPILAVYSELYTAWQASIRSRMGKTLALTNNFELLSKPWIREWQRKVYDEFDEESPEARALFPDNKSPFQKLGYDERIQAVRTLAHVMENYPALATVKADVEAKLLLLETARDEQKQAMQKVGESADALEKQRLALADALYKDLADLMGNHYQKPTDAERYFDLTQLRRSSTDADTSFSQEGQVDAETSVVISIPKRFELGINANFIFANSEGGSELHVFFAESASVTDSPNKAVVLPGTTLDTRAGELGWNVGKGILIVRNMGTMTSEFEMTGMEATV